MARTVLWAIRQKQAVVKPTALIGRVGVQRLPHQFKLCLKQSGMVHEFKKSTVSRMSSHRRTCLQRRMGLVRARTFEFASEQLSAVVPG